MKNVCFFNSITFWGGGEKLQLENALEFKKKNYNTFVASNMSSTLHAKATAKNLQILDIQVGNLSFLNPIKLIKAKAMFKKNNIDTVVFTTSQDMKFGGIAAKWAGVSKIVYQRGLAAPVKPSFINRYLFKKVLTHIISNSEATKQCILNGLKNHIPHGKVHTIYHGIETKDIDTESRLNIIKKINGQIVLGNAGRLTKQKDQARLIEVATILKDKNIDFKLYIAGTGELQEELLKAVESNKLDDHVILLGFVKNTESFYNSIDIFLQSSQWEGFGFVIVEAMIKNKPVVAFNVSSNPEIITQNETGFLVEYPNTVDFAKKVEELILDEKLRITMGEKAKESVINRFEIGDRITELEQYLLQN